MRLRFATAMTLACVLAPAAAMALACVVAPAAAQAARGSTVPVSIPAAKAKLRANVCQKALDPGQRMVSVTAVMRPIAGTRSMQLRFDLLSRTVGTTVFAPVRGGDLGTWISPSQPTLGQRPGDVWVLNHPVADVPAPAIYRFQVSFRWIGAHSRTLGTVVRTGLRCVQPELRPDLQVQSVTVTPNAKGTKDRYDATIYNGGKTPAGPFVVNFTYQDPSTGAPVVVPANVPGLRAHRSLVLHWDGPLCKTTAPPAIDVDPAGQVGDYNTANNTYQVVCPS